MIAKFPCPVSVMFADADRAAISASGPGPRPPSAAPQRSSGYWRDYLHTLGETINEYRSRRETNRVVRRIRAGELERGDIDAWAARATANSGFGGAALNRALSAGISRLRA